MSAPTFYDVVVIGSGPAGQKAAVHAARHGKRVLLVEQEVSVGGACVHRGTIPSKTLRETAVALSGFQRRTGEVFQVWISEDLQVASLMTRMEKVIKAYEHHMDEQLRRVDVTCIHGRARFVNPRVVEVVRIGQEPLQVEGGVIVVATGSEPRDPANVAIDHEHILDSDSILSMIYLPRSLVVLGGGVIAAEYACIFSALGVQVTMVDSQPRPLAFLDPELSECLVRSFEERGGRFIPSRKVERSYWDGVQAVVTVLDGGEELRSEKLLCCMGRVANLRGLQVENSGIEVTERGVIRVDAHYATRVPHIYAVGDVIGPPSLAATSMDQGRRAIDHALGLGEHAASETIPAGIYTIPEISSVGLSEAKARERHGEVLVGRARFDQVARGQIAAITDGLLKMIAAPDGKLLGVHIVGEGASDLIHVAQMALLAGYSIDVFVDNTFNFPTLAEAYRVAALDIFWQRSAAPAVGVPATT